MQIAPINSQPAAGARTPDLDSPRGKLFLQTLAKVTGVGEDDLKAQLKAGTSVADILDGKGISRADFHQALEKAHDQAQGAGGAHHRHHHKPAEASGDAASELVSTLASALGLNADEVKQQLANGEDLAKIAADNGISAGDLSKALRETFQSLLPYGPDGGQAAGNVGAAQVNVSA